jgi:hypothetical protein
MAHSKSSPLNCNVHVVRDLRRKLENRHSPNTATREILDRLSDDELLKIFLKNERMGRAHAEKLRVQKKETVAR